MATEYEDPYPRRVVTFIDLLGFTRDVMKLDQNLALYQSINAVLRRIADCKRDIDKKRQQPGGPRFDHRMTQFSDCVLMSYENVPGASLRAIADAAFIGQVICGLDTSRAAPSPSAPSFMMMQLHSEEG